MPFLFVDYDQGAGGEYLSYIISQSPQCVPLNGFKTATGRYKINDIFNQEFLKPNPVPKLVDSDDKLYNVVPSHQNTQLAATILNDVRSLRISNPTSNELWNYMKKLQLEKVLLATEPTPGMFAGFVKILQESATNPDFLSAIKYGMDNMTLTLIANNIEPTEENKNQFINELYKKLPEPEYAYDLLIPYEKLVLDPVWVQESIERVFKITVDLSLLSTYKNIYENRTS